MRAAGLTQHKVAARKAVREAASHVNVNQLEDRDVARHLAAARELVAQLEKLDRIIKVENE